MGWGLKYAARGRKEVFRLTRPVLVHNTISPTGQRDSVSK